LSNSNKQHLQHRKAFKIEFKIENRKQKIKTEKEKREEKPTWSLPGRAAHQHSPTTGPTAPAQHSP
jgi:hypothetical protein